MPPTRVVLVLTPKGLEGCRMVLLGSRLDRPDYSDRYSAVVIPGTGNLKSQAFWTQRKVVTALKMKA